ncbi:MAG: GH1 family beta-glucosidase [Phycisphaerales bacterium]
MSFTKGFTWGVAAAAYQIEGATEADGRVPSVWDAFADHPGAVRGGHTGRVACDHYHLYEKDADLIAGLGVGAYRLSIAWPRVMNESGKPNEAGLAFYDRLVDALLARGIEPWVTLFHWDFPLHLFHRGGWLNRDAADWFADYTQLVVDRLSDRVSHWMTLNEPQVYIDHGHCTGAHAPGMKYDLPSLLRIIHHSLLAHGRAVRVIRERAQRKPSIGWAVVGCAAIPATTSAADVKAARAATLRVGEGHGWLFNTTWYADAALLGKYPEDGLALHGKHMPAGFEADMPIIHQPMDFYGANIYQCGYVCADEKGGARRVAPPPGGPYTQIGWPVTPEALYWGPRFIYERYGLPIYLTESGCAGMDWVHQDGKVHDTPRIDYLARHLCALREASDDGIDIRGFFLWSIMDNFEWAWGYDQRFGLVHVDFKTQKRTPKDSYAWYRQVVETNGGVLPRKAAPLMTGFGPGAAVPPVSLISEDSRKSLPDITHAPAR